MIVTASVMTITYVAMDKSSHIRIRAALERRGAAAVLCRYLEVRLFTCYPTVAHSLVIAQAPWPRARRQCGDACNGLQLAEN
jgi:hypothetical protein